MSRVAPPITAVTGGVAGLAATYAALRALADHYDAAVDRMRGWAVAGARTAVDPDLLESAPLSPTTFAEAEAALLAATGGSRGVLESAVEWEADALLVRAMVDAFAGCDRLVATAYRTLDYLAGRTVVFDLACAAPGLVAGGLVARQLPSAWRARLGAEAGDLAQQQVIDHPGLTEHAVDGLGGLLDGVLAAAPVLRLPAFHPTTASAAADLAALYGAEGPPQVRHRPDLSVALGRTPPRSLADLVRHLGETNALSPSDRPGDQGTIEVQTLRAPDGTVRHVVYLPGTDDLATTPISQDGDVRDLPTDLHLVAGQHTTYAAGIEQAMREAGIRPHEPVLLAGHSQGGMEAADLLAHGSSYHVTDVVTAGSPIGGLHDYPAGSHVLSLENRGDVVPLLDGRENADSVQHVTVRFDDHEASVAGNHDLRHYVRGAAAVDSSSDPSIREQLAALRRHGFLGDHATATSEVFQVTR